MKIDLDGIVWRCLYCLETETNIKFPLGSAHILSASVSVSGSVTEPLEWTKELCIYIFIFIFLLNYKCTFTCQIIDSNKTYLLSETANICCSAGWHTLLTTVVLPQSPLPDNTVTASELIFFAAFSWSQSDRIWSNSSLKRVHWFHCVGFIDGM